MQISKSYRLRGLVLALTVAGLFHLAEAQTSAPDRSSEAGEATITDPTEECTAYSYPAVSSQLSSFPSVWEKASILENDSEAQEKWNSINGSIPTNISVKTQPPPDSYPSDDPDCWWTDSLCTNPKLSGLPADVSAAPEPSTLGYGFDDGPNCSHNVFYDYLDSQNQKATFYFIGSNVADWPLEAQRALADGHEICAHTWSHPYMTTFSSEDVFAELWYCTSRFLMQMIKLVVGVTPTCWRPPYGDVDDRVRSIANGLGLQTIMWEYDTADASVNGKSITDQTVVNNYNDFINTAKNGTFNSSGAIILTHELNNFTMSEAVQYYPQLKSVFQHIVPVGVSLNKTQPYVESNYSLPTFEQYISGILMTNDTRVSSNDTSTDPGSLTLTTAPSATTGSSSDSSAASSNAGYGGTNLGFKTFGMSVSFVVLCLLW